MNPLGPDKRPCCLCGVNQYVYSVAVSYMADRGLRRKLQVNSVLPLCTDCRKVWFLTNEVISPSEGRFCENCVARLERKRRPVWSKLMDRSASVLRTFTCCVCKLGGKKQHHWTTDENLAELVRETLLG